jgi:general secretion pathway protein A
MYLEYYGFSEEPFNITPNSRFLFLSQRHREALAALLYGIEQRKGFIALTGEIGCGKTTICRAMLGKLDRTKTRLALVLNPEFNDLELLQTINAELGLESKSTSKRELLDALNRFLLNEYKNDRNVVLLIDEAQRLPPDALEQVRLISNLETETAKLIQIALIGQPELADILDLPELEQLNQRITVRYHIEPLSLEEVAEYIEHRVKIAEAKQPVRFTKAAVQRIFEYSLGVPRRVNVLCDRALLVTFVREEKEVSAENIEKAIEELGGMPKRRRKKLPAHVREEEERVRQAEQEAEEDDLDEIPGASDGETEAAEVAAGDESRNGSLLWALAILVGLGIVGFFLTKMAYGPPRPESEVAVATPKRATSTVMAAADPPRATPAPEPTPSPSPAATAAPTATIGRAAVEVAALPATPSPLLETPAPSPTATLTPTPQPTAAPASPTAAPSPEPSSPAPTAAVEEEFVPITSLKRKPTPAPTAAPEPATPAATPEPTAPAPEPSPTAALTPAPTADSSTMITQLMTSPVPTPVAAAARPSWIYDENGIVRVDSPEYTYPAAVLSWLALKRNERLPERELAVLRGMKREQVASLQLTAGRAPLYVREARLPANITLLTPAQFPALLQLDDKAPGIGPWAVLIASDGKTFTLLDPRAGRMTLPADMVEDFMASIVVPFFDPKGITGLKPGAQGDAVSELQRLLKQLGVYMIEPSGDYNAFTEAAVTKSREKFGLPGGSEIDPLLALRLLTEGNTGS